MKDHYINVIDLPQYGGWVGDYMVGAINPNDGSQGGEV